MPPQFFFIVHQSSGGKKDWRWRMYGPHDKMVAVCGEGYADKDACLDAIQDLSGQSAQPVIRYASG